MCNPFHKSSSSSLMLHLGRGVARGGAEGARAPPEFGRSVNPIQTRGGRLCPPHYCQPPRIQKAIYISAKFKHFWLKKSTFSNEIIVLCPKAEYCVVKKCKNVTFKVKMSKSINLLISFSAHYNLGAYFLLLTVFPNFNF